MSKILEAAVVITVTVAAIVAWSKFSIIKPAATATTHAAAAESGPIISPFDAMTKHSKSLPLEDWRPAN